MNRANKKGKNDKCNNAMEILIKSMKDIQNKFEFFWNWNLKENDQIFLFWLRFSQNKKKLVSSQVYWLIFSNNSIFSPWVVKLRLSRYSPTLTLNKLHEKIKIHQIIKSVNKTTPYTHKRIICYTDKYKIDKFD